MEKIFVAPNAGCTLSIDYKGIHYEFRLLGYDNVGGYAPILVIDCTNDERYVSNGYLEINNHVIESRWKMEYNSNRGNWICSKDIIISIS